MRPTSGLGFNRLSVERALARAAALWRRLDGRDYPNGFVIFCSEDLAEAVHPPLPLRRRVYSCGRRFDTSALRAALQAERGAAYGAIAIDGAEATFGTVLGLSATAGSSAPVVTQLGHITSTTAARTRRGGQSALRYARLRDEAELAFLRRAAETAVGLLGGVQGLILAGKADMKRKLLQELPERLRGQVLCCVDLPGAADLEGLRRAALSASGTAAAREGGRAESAAERFLELAAMPEAEGARYCYGEPQCEAALRLGAVDELLVAADFRGPSGRSAKDWEALTSAHGAALLTVPPRGEASVRFCGAFGVGALLRWAVRADLLEDEEADADGGSAPADPEPQGAPAAPAAAAAGEAAAGAAGLEAAEGAAHPAASSPAAAAAEHGGPSRRGVLAWLEGELKGAVDHAAAEALAVCVEVILLDETTPAEEALHQADGVLADEGVPREVRRALEGRWREATGDCGAPRAPMPPTQ